MSKWKWSLLMLVAACNFGHNRIPDNGIGVDAAQLPVDAEHDEVDARPPDAMAAGSGCELLPQGGCTGATPACDLTSADDGTVECRAVTAPGTSTDHCATDTACATGYTCTHGSDATDDPWCARFCDHDTDCTGSGSRCVVGLIGSHGQSLGIDVCSASCDLVAQTGCPSSRGCYAFEPAGSGSDYTDCENPGTVAIGGTCTIDEDCVAGGVCVGNAATGTCASICVVGDDTTCPGNLTCVGFTVPLTINGTEYGACQ
jgi:hypothetical protein